MAVSRREAMPFVHAERLLEKGLRCAILPPNRSFVLHTKKTAVISEPIKTNSQG